MSQSFAKDLHYFYLAIQTLEVKLIYTTVYKKHTQFQLTIYKTFKKEKFINRKRVTSSIDALFPLIAKLK